MACPEVVDENRLINGVAGYDLYNGLPGIALFLGHLGGSTGQSGTAAFAIAAMAEALELYKTDRRDAPPSGAFDGIGGLAYALVQLANLG